MPAPRLMHFQANENHRGFLGTGHIDWPNFAARCSRSTMPARSRWSRSAAPTTPSGVPLAQWKPPACDEDPD